MSEAEVTPAPREHQEPRGRWENRCDYAWEIGGQQVLICDRPLGHKGLHRGRIWFVRYYSADPFTHVRGYGAHR